MNRCLREGLVFRNFGIENFVKVIHEGYILFTYVHSKILLVLTFTFFLSI